MQKPRQTSVLREPRMHEIEDINRLILRSKAVWGYDAAFMEACKEELAITPDLLRDHHFMVAVDGDALVGVAEVSLHDQTAHLDKLFVDPNRLRSGAGRQLFAWARDKARDENATCLLVEADPGAEGFYCAMGAKRVGEVPSGSIPGRMLPHLKLQLQT